MSDKNNKSQEKIEDLLKKIRNLFEILASSQGIEQNIPVVIDNMNSALASQLKMVINFGNSKKKLKYEEFKELLEICEEKFGRYDFAELYKNGNKELKRAVSDICPKIEEYIEETEKTEENSLFNYNNLPQSIG